MNWLSTKWEKIKSVKPGERFQKRYYRINERRGQRSTFLKIIYLITGLAICLVGVFFLFVPGSGWLILFIGASFIAGESLFVAKTLDYFEEKIRKYLEI